MPQIDNGQLRNDNSDCCKIPKTNREFWVSKIRRNRERDRKVQQQLAAMGWHCITVWECELKPNVREHTLTSLAYTLNKIFLQDHSIPHTTPCTTPQSMPHLATDTTHHYVIPEQPSQLAAEPSPDHPTDSSPA